MILGLTSQVEVAPCRPGFISFFRHSPDSSKPKTDKAPPTDNLDASVRPPRDSVMDRSWYLRIGLRHEGHKYSSILGTHGAKIGADLWHVCLGRRAQAFNDSELEMVVPQTHRIFNSENSALENARCLSDSQGD